MNRHSPWAVLSLIALASVQAQFVTPEAVDWEKVRAAQPDGLSLKMEISKNAYHLGQVIDATLTFSNTSLQPYHLWVGTHDRSGRIPDIAVYAFDADGNPVADPLRWYFERGGMGGGLGNVQDLGEWKITLPANQWLRFAKPGTYTLRAFSNRVQKGDRFEQGNRQENRVELVSDPVSISIGELNPAEEQRIIGEAVAQLASGGKEAEAGAATLRYLGTPASRAALLPFLSSGPRSFSAMMAFYAAQNPAEEAPTILEAVRSGKLKFNPGLSHLYGTLKSAGFRFTPLLKTREEQEALGKRFQAAFRQAADEITAAATAATGGKGPDFYQTIIATLFQDPVKRPQARVELVKIQLELTPEQGDTILRSWKDFGGEDFLPLVRKLAGPPSYNPNALKALAAIKPEEARPLVIEDIQREKPRYLIPKAASRIANAPLLTLPPKPIPELDLYFEVQLSKEHPPKLDLLMDSIDRYGSPALLPGVIKFYLPKEGEWACDIQKDVLRFWLRHDPPAGLEALKRALDSREHTRCYTSVLSGVLLEEWSEAALPIVTAALDDPDPEVVASAIKVLEAHTDAAHLGPSLIALQRISASATKQNLPAYHAARGTAQQLLQSTRWKPDPEQRRQLEALAAARPR